MTLDLTSQMLQPPSFAKHPRGAAAQALHRRRLRAHELYNRLPEIYRVRDWQRAFEHYGDERVRAGEAVPELEAFLGLIADEIIRLRDNIGDLWDDFFIETCAEWVVPYLGDLLGANLVFNAAQRNRVEVANTIEWRRRKGTLTMLADLAGDITGWEAEAAEFFENLNWAQNLDHLKLNHAQAPDLRDPYRLNLLGTARDPWMHTVDVRRPQGRQGWYHPKTVGLFLSRLNAYPLQGVTPHPERTLSLSKWQSKEPPRVVEGPRPEPVEGPVGVSPACFTFDPLGRDIPLFDRRRRQPIATLAAGACDPYTFFGDPDGFAIRQHGILIATSRPPTPEPTEANALWSGFGDDPPGRLKAETGLEWMEPEKFENPMRRFEITALWGNNFTDSLTTLGSLRNFSTPFTLADPATRLGVFMLNLKLGAGSDAALFPATVIAVRNDRADPHAADSRASRYQDALYVYLPEVSLAEGDELNLYVADDGSTYHAPPDLHRPYREGKLDHTLLARAALGQCFPARRLSNSFDPSDIVDLHHAAGLRLANEALFKNTDRQFLIEARRYAPDLDHLNSPDNLVGQLPTYSDSDDDDYSDEALTAFHYKPNLKISIGEGDRLVLKISRGPLSTEVFFPMTDLIVTDRSGRALLVALPEINFDSTLNPKFADPVWLFFDTEGATYYASGDSGHDTALARTERGAAFRFDPQETRSGLARKSAGQVLALPGRFPIQQRTPLYADLCQGAHPKPRPLRTGQLAVDPARGRFCFAPGETPQASRDGLRVDYSEGFAHDIGALTYDRYASLKAPENPQPTRFVARSGDADCGAAPVYSNLDDALNAAQDGDVIQIEDSATYEHTTDLIIPSTLKRLVIQSANRQRPCLRFTSGATLRVTGALEALRLNGLLISGAALEMADASQVKQVELIACTLDPTAGAIALLTHEASASKPLAQISLCRCIAGGLQLGPGVAELVVSDSILDRQGGVVIAANGLAHLERVTAWGAANVRQLYASECVLVDVFSVSDRQAGCVRYSRFQIGSELPRCFQCVPADNNPAFNSQRFGRPDYAQLHLNCPEAILTGAEGGVEVGAFNGALATLRAKNLGVKLDEYLPVGLTPALIYVT